MPSSKLFDTLYKQLNPEQRKAVDAIEGPVMVVAGPGTGKTQILTLRIANILQETDIEPENILALTFTDAAAHEMRERLKDIMGSLAYRVGIFTFHGFCNDIIQRNPDEFEAIVGAVSITDTEQVEMAKTILRDSSFRHLKPFGNPLYYVRPLLKRVSDLKKAGIGTEEFSKHIKEQETEFSKRKKGRTTGREEGLKRQIQRNKELALFYVKYQESLLEQHLYDYDDMILRVVEVLSQKGELLVSLQEQYLYMLADEHQDVNHSQNMVLELLSSFHKSPNLFIVGDEKQAIFRFQGASLENFRYFEQKHPDVNLIQLRKSYRSTQTILDGAGHVMNVASGSLLSIKSKGEPISVYEFSSPDIEMYALTEQIKALAKQGVKTKDIAVLVRDNKDAFPVVRMLEKQGIPFVLESEQEVLGDEDIKKLILLFEGIQEFGSDELLFKILSLDFFGLDALSVLKQVRYAKAQGISLAEAIRYPKGVGRKRLGDISKSLARWHTIAQNQNVRDVFEAVVRESGFLSYILLKKNSFTQMEKLRALHEEMRLMENSRQQSSLQDFLSHIDIMQENNLSLRVNIKAPELDGVRVMTVHKAKGREFTYVFLVNVYDGHWGNRRIRKTFLLPSSIALAADFASSEDEEERKLFYVALTRARKAVVISYAKIGLDGRARLPSRFILEIAEKFRKRGEAKVYEKAFEKRTDVLFSPSLLKGPDYKEKAFVKEVVASRGFSVTALNNYLSCPWKYFYLNLVQIPQSLTRPQLYGTLIHNTLRDFFNKFSKEKKATKSYLLSRFKFHASHLFSREEQEEICLRGTHALSGYYEAYKKNWKGDARNEVRIRDVVLNNSVRLTGVLDKIEIEEGKKVNVVDYKTGRPRSRNDIEGKTKGSEGDYKRQLVFYKLLLSRHQKGRYVMETGELDFVEPNLRGKYKKEKFAISDEEVRELEKLILKVISEIAGLKFWKRKCRDSQCEFCALRQAHF